MRKRINQRIKRGLAAIAAQADAGSIPEDILGIHSDSIENLPPKERAAVEKQIAEIEEALEYLWSLTR